MKAYLPVLMFHSLENGESPVSFPPNLFRRGMARLREQGYRVLSLDDAVDHLQRGLAFPSCSAVITFDDGYRSVYEEAFPVLQRLGFPATVFLSVGNSGTLASGGRLPSLKERTMLSWPEIREMMRFGVTFGAHSLTHPELDRLAIDTAIFEIRESKAVIEDNLGTTVTSFSYPYGRYNSRIRDVVKRFFSCACSDRLGLVTGDSDFLALERIDAGYLRNDLLFGMLSTRIFPFYIRMRSFLVRTRRFPGKMK